MTASEFNHRKCPLCSSDATHGGVHSKQTAQALTMDALQPFWSGLFKEKLFFSYHRCDYCGLLYNPVYFHDRQLAQLYADMAPNMDLVADDAIVATQQGYFERAAERTMLDGGYLEIGPDVGYIVANAARTGNFEHFWLFEPNLAIHDTLRANTGGRPASLFSDMSDLSPVPDNSVGLAVMIHVLDHLTDPLAMLQQVRAKLRPGGTLLVVTHNEQSLLRKALGVRWPPFCLQHPELYNPTTMRTMLQRAGLATIQVERSRNYFPVDFLARQAAWAMGLKLKKVPLPATPVGLRLGNILALASAPV
jgi:SAM-dependent methyltransferase